MAKITMIKDLKLKIFDLFLFSYYQTPNPLTPNTPYLAHSFIKFKNYLLTNVLLSFRIKGTMCEDLILVELLSVRSPAYLPYTIVLFQVQQ